MLFCRFFIDRLAFKNHSTREEPDFYCQNHFPIHFIFLNIHYTLQEWTINWKKLKYTRSIDLFLLIPNMVFVWSQTEIIVSENHQISVKKAINYLGRFVNLEFCYTVHVIRFWNVDNLVAFEKFCRKGSERVWVEVSLIEKQKENVMSVHAIGSSCK